MELLFELQCFYHEVVSATSAYYDMENAVKNGRYYDRQKAQSVLDGAHGAREAEIAHIRDRIFTLLRNFFEPLEHDPSE